VAALVLASIVRTVITQNVDDLHRRSGIEPEQIIELHGNGTYAKCLTCQERHELEWVRCEIERKGEAPVCPRCGGLVKSATISFGQRMPEQEMADARAASLRADVFLAVGSSLQVRPAANLPIIAKHNGARLVIINREPTPLDSMANLVVHDELGSVLQAVARRVASEGNIESKM
jgi:NAD-dependent deacetylase